MKYIFFLNNCIIKVVDASRSRARFHECKDIHVKITIHVSKTVKMPLETNLNKIVRIMSRYGDQ